MNSSANFRFKSFLFAYNGLKEVKTQPNFRIHLVFVFLVFAAGFFLKISIVEWCLVSTAIGLVTAAECFNTALEYLTNLVSPQQNETAGKVKDLAAAGVLICSFIAAIIGLLIFVPKIIERFLS